MRVRVCVRERLRACARAGARGRVRACVCARASACVQGHMGHRDRDMGLLTFLLLNVLSVSEKGQAAHFSTPQRLQCEKVENTDERQDRNKIWLQSGQDPNRKEPERTHTKPKQTFDKTRNKCQKDVAKAMMAMFGVWPILGMYSADRYVIMGAF